MKKKLSVLVLTCILVLSVSLFAFSQVKMLPPPVKQALHEVNVLKIDAKKDTTKIWELMQNPNTADICKLNLPRENLTGSHIRLLKDWVKKGHALWVTTNNRDFFRDFDVTFGIKTDLLDDRRAPQNFVAKSTQKHPVLTDVKEISFTSRVDRFDYDTEVDLIRLSEGYDIPLLESHGVVVGALQYMDNGVIYFLPELEKDKYSGARFYVNLLEFGAGYPVPPSIVSGEIFTEPTEKYGRVILQNGDVLSGKILNETISINTEYGEFSFPKDKISFISQDKNLDRLKLKTGDQLTGSVKNKSLQIDLSIGGEKTISLEDIKKIVFQQ